MSDIEEQDDTQATPGESHGVGSYVIGLVLAAGLTGAAFLVAAGGIVWGPAAPMALIALGVAQIGVHLVFFLRITSGPENLNNGLALAFGTLIVLLLVGGSIWIMAHLDHNMMPMNRVMAMQR